MIVALTHGYPPTWAMGGEVSLHRTLTACRGPVTVLTRTDEPYTLDGIRVERIAADAALDQHADPAPIARQLADLDASVVVAQNELSLPAVRAARSIGVPSVVSVHTPPRYGRGIAQAVREADAAIYNTRHSAVEWGEPDALVLHPPIPRLPPKPATPPHGDACTLLSNLLNKGVTVALELARRMPQQRFVIVRSPAEATHGMPDFDRAAARLPNVEVHPRVPPDLVAERYLSQTRILLVPSRYETYGMSAIEAAGHGIPAVHVDTPHVREGIADGASLVPPLDADATEIAVREIEADFAEYSLSARVRADQIAIRQEVELAAWAEWIGNVRILTSAERAQRQRRIRRR